MKHNTKLGLLFVASIGAIALLVSFVPELEKQAEKEATEYAKENIVSSLNKISDKVLISNIKDKHNVCYEIMESGKKLSNLDGISKVDCNITVVYNKTAVEKNFLGNLKYKSFDDVCFATIQTRKRGNTSGFTKLNCNLFTKS
jgi:hypothetical protein